MEQGFHGGAGRSDEVSPDLVVAGLCINASVSQRSVPKPKTGSRYGSLGLSKTTSITREPVRFRNTLPENIVG